MARDNSDAILNVDAYPAPPEGLALEQVHVYVRHGERTPVRTRLRSAIPEYWNLCKEAKTFTATVYPQNTMPLKRSAERGDGTSFEGECTLGQLTDLGRKSAHDFGLALRKLYVQRLGLLPDKLDNGKVAYFRSTNMERTIETLHQVISGLYPAEKLSNGFIPTYLTRQWKDEDLIGNMQACARLKQIELEVGDQVAKEENPKLAQFDSLLSKYVDGNPIRVDGKPRLSGVMDTIRAAEVHGLAIPEEFRNKTVTDALEAAICKEWFTGYLSQEFRKLAMGRLLGNLATKMELKATKGDSDPLKLAVMACHDTSLAGMCTTLDVFDNRWPEFTGSVTFELFSQKIPSTSFLKSLYGGTDKKHYVRMRYKNRDMKLPFCSASGDHLGGSPEYCTLDAFKRHVEQFVPKDWAAECEPLPDAKKAPRN